MAIVARQASIAVLRSTGEMAVVDPRTLSTRGSCALVPSPGGLDVDDRRRRAYVVDPGGTAGRGPGLVVVALDSLRVVARVDLGDRTSNLADVAVDVDAGRVYVTDRANGVLHVVDARTDAVLPSIRLGGPHVRPSSIAVNPATGTLFVAMGLPGIAIVDGREGLDEELVPLPDACVDPRDLAVVPPNHSTSARVCVATADGVAIVTLDQHRSRRWVVTPSPADAVAVDPLVGLVFAATADHGVVVIDPGTGSIVSRFDAPACVRSGLAVADDGTVYVQSAGDERPVALRSGLRRPPPSVGPLRLVPVSDGNGRHLFRQTETGRVDVASRPAEGSARFGWSPWREAGETLPGAPMVIVPRRRDGWDVWSVGIDGRLGTSSSSVIGRFPLGAELASGPGGDVIMAVDVDGVLRGAAGIGLRSRPRLGPGAPVAAAGPEVFAVAGDGTVWAGAAPGWRSTGIGPSVAEPASPVTAVVRNGRTHLFVTGLDGQVAHGRRLSMRMAPWRWEPVAGWLFPRRTRVTAVDTGGPDDSRLELLAVDCEGAVWCTRHRPAAGRGSPGWQSWEPVAGACGQPDGTVVVAFGSTDGAVDVVWVGSGGAIDSVTYCAGASADCSSRREAMPSLR